MFDGLMIILVALSALYIAYVVGEHFYCKSRRKKLTHVIHVNGIRGKSTVTRLIDAGLRACGLRVFSKTTGTVPMTIDVDGRARPVRRLGPANIREQMRVLCRAANRGAQALVVECMAVNPELQYLTEHRILHADVNVITNVREDHMDEMGRDLESIAYSLANTTPDGGTVVLGDGAFAECFERCAAKTGSVVKIARPYEGEDDMGTFRENIAAALCVCEVLGLDRAAYFEGMKNYIRDPGALSEYRVGDTVLINGFSANDSRSTLDIYERVLAKYPAEDVCVLLNVRSDRPDRLRQHLEMLTSMSFGNLLVAGSNTGYVIGRMKKKGVTARRVSRPEELLNQKIVFGCGNIAAAGMKITEFFKCNCRQALTVSRSGGRAYYGAFGYTYAPALRTAYEDAAADCGVRPVALVGADARTLLSLRFIAQALGGADCGVIAVAGPFAGIAVRMLRRAGADAARAEEVLGRDAPPALFGCGGERTAAKAAGGADEAGTAVVGGGSQL